MEITLLTYLILLGSLGFIWISHTEVEYKLKRLKNGYNGLKNIYIDLLDERDIKEIFKNDTELDNNIKELEQVKRKIIRG